MLGHLFGARRMARAAGALALASAVTIGGGDLGKALAATVDARSFTLSTTGAVATGTASRSTDSMGGNVYALRFTLKDTGNEGRPVYVKYRWSALVSGPGGLAWRSGATSTLFNNAGYGTSVTATARLTDAQLRSMAAAGGSSVQAAKLQGQIAVCRDLATTDNCSGWFSQVWNTYPATAFQASFLCNMSSVVLDIRNFVNPAYVPSQSAAFNLTVMSQLIESDDSTFSRMVVRDTITNVISYPSPFAIATQSFVYRLDAASNTLVLDDGYVGWGGLTPGKYYAIRSSAWIQPTVGTDQPAYSWAAYTFQNGWVQGTPGDFKCLAR